jgi:hypothetical protein
MPIPSRVARSRVQVGFAGVVVVDLGSEEFQHALHCLWRQCERPRRLQNRTIARHLESAECGALEQLWARGDDERAPVMSVAPAIS